MPSRRRGNDLVLFSANDPRALVNWLCETYGLPAVLRSVSQYRGPRTTEAEGAPVKRAYKRRAAKKGGGKKRGAAKKGGRRGRRSRWQAAAGTKAG